MVHDFDQFVHKGVSVVAVDANGLVALEKPCMILSHPNQRTDEKRSVFSCKYDFKHQAYVYENSHFYLLNRLDSPVSGIILIGLNEEIASAVRKSFEEKKVVKKYSVLVKGFVPQKRGIWRSKLKKIITEKSMRVTSGTGVFAETKYECLESFRCYGITLSILNLFPITGKTHQLRVHCAQNNLPIVGDETYGDHNFNAFFRKNIKLSRLMLHSEQVSLSYNIRGENFDFQAISPVNFSQSLKNLRENCRS